MNSKLKNLVAATLAGSFLMGFGATAMADSTDDIINALIAKGVLTEEEGALLMKGRTGEKEAAEAKKASSVSAKFKDGLSFESGDGSFKAKIAGRVQTDYRNFNYNDNDTNTAPSGTGTSIGNVTNLADTFDVRRARIGFEAKYKDYYEGVLSVDLVGANGSGSATSVTVVDQAYLNVAWWQPVQFRFGVFKAPMNLEKLTSSNNIDFMERSFVNLLAPNEQIGAMVHGVPFTGVTYQLGAFNGGPTRSAESDMREDEKEFVARATVNFAEIMGNKDMISHVGISYSNGDLPQGGSVSQSFPGINARTEARGATFFRSAQFTSSPYSSDQRDRLGLEAALAYNQFKAQAEWMKQTDKFDTATRGYDLDINNWYLEGLWTITGEKYADGYKNGVMGGIKPNKDFDPKTFTGGAWEVGVRYSEFDASDYDTTGIAIGSTADAQITTKAAGFAKAEAWTLGLKFLPNSNMRFMLNYVDTNFKDVIGGTTGGILVNNKRVDDEQALIARAQWMF